MCTNCDICVRKIPYLVTFKNRIITFCVIKVINVEYLDLNYVAGKISFSTLSTSYITLSIKIYLMIFFSPGPGPFWCCGGGMLWWWFMGGPPPENGLPGPGGICWKLGGGPPPPPIGGPPNGPISESSLDKIWFFIMVLLRALYKACRIY